MSKIISRLSLLIILGTSITNSYGEERPNIDCQSVGSVVEENYCLGVELRKTDLELNAAYSNLRAKLSAPRKNDLANLELKWIKLRDEICHFETEPTLSGNGWIGFKDACLIRLTKNRIADIKAAMKYEE